MKGGEGRASGKGLNSRYGGHWKLEKVFFNESVSTILQLVVGPLLFLIYINDTTDDLASHSLIYADDTTLLEIVDDPAVSADRLNSDLNKTKYPTTLN